MDKANIINRIEGVAILFALISGFLSSCQWLPEVGSVRLSESSVTLKVGGSKQLTAIVEPAAAEYEGITWTSSDLSVAIVTNGTISARKVGTTTISATAAGVTSNPCQVTVDATHVTGISLSNYSVEIIEGESTTLNATVSPSDATDPSFSWGSDNTSVATVQNGKIVAISPGTANISVRTTDGNKTATCKVTVKSKVIDVTGITLSQSSVSIKEEETLQLKATVKPSNATNQEVSWSSDNKNVATVASDGTVTAITEGTVTITAKSADGKVSSTCKVTVTAEYVDFPDPNFRKYMVENFDLNGNGKISLSEAIQITKINVNTDNIESLEGIEKCRSLSHLECEGSYSNNQTNGLLKSLNLSGNPALIFLRCGYNKLSTLDVSNNDQLQIINCKYNNLNKLDLSHNYALTELAVEHNLLTSLGLSQNKKLCYLFCSYNNLSSINVSLNTNLIMLYCTGNQIDNLDVSHNPELKYLCCGGNKLTSLDISENPMLIWLVCDGNQLTSLNVSQNKVLTLLQCSGNKLTSLDVSKNTALTDMSCILNRISSLDVSNNKSLKSLFCWGNSLTILDVSNNTVLEELGCSPMNNDALRYIYMASGQSIEYTEIPSYTQIVRK